MQLPALVRGGAFVVVVLPFPPESIQFGRKSRVPGLNPLRKRMPIYYLSKFGFSPEKPDEDGAFLNPAGQEQPPQDLARPRELLGSSLGLFPVGRCRGWGAPRGTSPSSGAAQVCSRDPRWAPGPLRPEQGTEIPDFCPLFGSVALAAPWQSWGLLHQWLFQTGPTTKLLVPARTE